MGRINTGAPEMFKGDRLDGLPWGRLEQGNSAAQPIRISAGEQQQISWIGCQGRTEQGGHQSVGIGEIEIEPLAPVALQLGHGLEGLPDRLHRTADTTETTPQPGWLGSRKLVLRRVLEKVVFPLQEVESKTRPLSPERKRETGLARDAEATDQSLTLPILQTGLHV